MVTTEMTDIPSARPGPANRTAPLSQQGMLLAAALTSSTTPAFTQKMASAWVSKIHTATGHVKSFDTGLIFYCMKNHSIPKDYTKDCWDKLNSFCLFQV